MSDLSQLRRTAGSGLNYTAECDLARSAVLVPRAGLAPIRVALLSSATVDHFVPILESRLIIAGFNPTIFVPPFGTVTQTLAGDKMYEFAPDVVWLASHWRDVDMRLDVRAQIEDFAQVWTRLRKRCAAFVVQNTFDLPSEQPLGNLAATVPGTPTAYLRGLNAALLDRSEVTLFDIEQLSAEFGRARWCDARFWHHSKHAFAFDAYGLVAHRFARLVAAARGRSARCLALDLDNTLWGGVVGEVGVDGIELGEGGDGEAFVAFQAYLLALRARGILLAVCSKNDAHIARSAFAHPDMRLHLEDFVSFHASWRNKAETLVDIASELNIAPDAIVFVDDEAVERELMRTLLPEVWVPEMPDDPADFVAALDGMRYFEAVDLTAEDVSRSAFYHRRELARDVADALGTLDMRMVVELPGGLALKRAVQLINKTNQFNLNGERTSEQALAPRAGEALCVRLLDRFGDHGIVSVVASRIDGDELTIDTWVMSCRVFARGVEDFVFGELLRVAREKQVPRMVARFIDTGRNHLVREALERLGFATSTSDSWVCDVSSVAERV